MWHDVTEDAYRAVGVAFLPLEHHVTPAHDERRHAVLLLHVDSSSLRRFAPRSESLETVSCQSAIGALRALLQRSSMVERKTPHLALGAGGALYRSRIGKEVACYGVRPRFTMSAPVCSAASYCFESLEFRPMA